MYADLNHSSMSLTVVQRNGTKHSMRGFPQNSAILAAIKNALAEHRNCICISACSVGYLLCPGLGI